MRPTAEQRFLLLLALVVGVVAPDNRLLYYIPKNETTAAFCACVQETCAAGSWKPHPPPELAYRGFICEPGDYSGKHADTEARIVCSWYNPSTPNSTSVLYTEEVAEELGAIKG
ncbi:hypothetical protein B0H14DRAFT_1367700 [Mycena olivaceomarginata]|nr:hypothetical protein B0H14DRAFT_1367700 [Mycena olivaceomarginata]